MSPYYDPNELTAAHDQVFSLGPVALTTVIPPVPFPATLASNAVWNSGLIPSGGFRVIAVGLTSSVAGTLTILRYLDPAGTVLQAAGSNSLVLVGGTPGVLNLDGGLPFAAFSINLANSAATATLSNFAVLLSAN